jgi:lysophospholipase L1-like esterase
VRSASTPPADAPTTTMSCRVVCSSGGTPLHCPARHSMIAPMPETILVAALGDSITEGSPGLRGWDVWAAQAELRFRFRNCGIYGERTDEIAARLDACVRDAEILIVQGGINDIAQGRDVGGAAENLRAMVRRGKELGLRVLLVDVLPWNNGWPDAEPKIRRLNELIVKIAHEERVPFVAFHDTLEDDARPGRMRDEWTFEGDHPNEDGYRLLADVVLAALQNV